MSVRTDGDPETQAPDPDPETGQFAKELQPPPPVGDATGDDMDVDMSMDVDVEEVDVHALVDVDMEEVDELTVDEDTLIENSTRLAGDTATTGVHRRVITPPPLPEAALRQRSQSWPAIPPSFPPAARVTTVPPPPPPPMPADFAALRSQLQAVNGRYNELLCERARLEKQLKARDSALDTLRLQNADLERLRSERAETEELGEELRLRAWPGDGGAPAADSQLAAELEVLRADREALRRLRTETAGFAAMRIELDRLRESHVDADRLRAIQKEVESLRSAKAEGTQMRARIAELEVRRSAAEQRSSEQINSLQQQLAAAEQQLVQQAGIATEALEELEVLSASVAGMTGRLAGQSRAHAEQIADLCAERDRLQGELDAARSQSSGGTGGLGAITGIGPTFATRLRARGVDVAAIANWTDDDVELIAADIQTQSGRIARQRWVEQARALVAGD